uniref:Leucine zipper putative tumor suppressor 2 homolog n=1 Tax=Xenopus tropicalis TaxID=8364 RepID=A0A5S6MGR4_XENTR
MRCFFLDIYIPFNEYSFSFAAVPKKTKSLIITDGNVSLINISSFLNLPDLTQLTLINSRIARIHEDTFYNLAKLKSLILDNNDISDASITEKTLFPLQNLEILKLNNNVLSSIYGPWFKSTNKLIRLELKGNHITKLTYISFRTEALGCLRHLDLSINFISFIEEYAFQALHQLRELDLSKNRLTTVPDTFSLLSHLILLNLSHNQWNCTCELQRLSDFLQNYTSSAARILKNENDLHCSYSSSPTVRTVLQLTGRNCLSAPHNITILKDKGKTFSLRDFVLIAVLCLAGAISLFCLMTVLVMLKLHKVSEEASRNCCSGIFRKIQGCLCTTNPHSKQHVNFRLNKGSETNVMSIMDYPGIENTTTEHGSSTAKQEFHPSNLSFRVKSKEMIESVKGSYFICLDCRLIQQCPCNAPDSLGNLLETNEVEGLTNIAERIVTNPRDFRPAAHWEGVHSTILQELSECNKETPPSC